MADSRCGTSAGYMAHRYVGEEPCEDCRKGHAARIAQHRAEHGRRDRLLSKARSRAYAALSKEYPERFRELYEQAKAEVFAAARATLESGSVPGTGDHAPTESVPEDKISDEGTAA